VVALGEGLEALVLLRLRRMDYTRERSRLGRENCFGWTPAGPEDVEIVDYH
jgi:hypothetical protein